MLSFQKEQAACGICVEGSTKDMWMFKERADCFRIGDQQMLVEEWIALELEECTSEVTVSKVLELRKHGI